MTFAPGTKVRVTGETPGYRDVSRVFTIDRELDQSSRFEWEARLYMVWGSSGAHLALRLHRHGLWSVSGYRRCSRITYIRDATVEVVS